MTLHRLHCCDLQSLCRPRTSTLIKVGLGGRYTRRTQGLSPPLPRVSCLCTSRGRFPCPWLPSSLCSDRPSPYLRRNASTPLHRDVRQPKRTESLRPPSRKRVLSVSTTPQTSLRGRQGYHNYSEVGVSIYPPDGKGKGEGDRGHGTVRSRITSGGSSVVEGDRNRYTLDYPGSHGLGTLLATIRTDRLPDGTSGDVWGWRRGLSRPRGPS